MTRQLSSKRNGLCGANSFALGVFYSKKPLPFLDGNRSRLFYHHLKKQEVNGYPNGLATRANLQEWFEANKHNPSEVQKVLAPAIHKVSVELAYGEYERNASVKFSYQEELVAAFENFIKRSCGDVRYSFDDTFYPMPQIKVAFNNLLESGPYSEANPPNEQQLEALKEQLKALWNNSVEHDKDPLWLYYFKERLQVSANSATSAQWASQHELNYLTKYWNSVYETMPAPEHKDAEQQAYPQIMLHAHTKQYELTFGSPGLKIGPEEDDENISSQQARELVNRGVGAFATREDRHTYFEVNSRISKNQLLACLNENKNKVAIIDAVFTQKKKNINDLNPPLSREEKTTLFLIGLIDRNGNFPNNPNQAVFENRLSEIPEDVQEKVIETYNNLKNLVHLHVYHSGSHWDVAPTQVSAESVADKPIVKHRPRFREVTRNPENKRTFDLIEELSKKSKLDNSDEKLLTELHQKLKSTQSKDIQEDIDARIAYTLDHETRQTAVSLSPDAEIEQVKRAKHEAIKSYAQFFQSRPSSRINSRPADDSRVEHSDSRSPSISSAN